jgi:Fe2+ transport system protein B
MPHYLLLNKADLRPAWQVTEEDITHLELQGVQVLKTSAKTGEGVELAFSSLAEAMLRES